MFTQALAFPLPLWLTRLVNFFAEADTSDKTDENDNDGGGLDDDLDNAFGDDEEGDAEGDDDSNEGVDKDGANKGKDNEGDKKPEKKDSSAIVQKQKFREKLRAAEARIRELEKGDKDGKLSDEDKKEKAANEFLAKKIKEVLTEIESEKESREAEIEGAFQEELDEVLDENTDITEKQILDMCEELEVKPKQALKIIKREASLKGKKDKPKMPDGKRGKGDIKDSDSKDKKPSTLDDVNRIIKEKIRKGLL